MELAGNKLGPGERRSKCRLCGEKGILGEIDIPYIFRFLVTQFAACNINVKLTFNQT